MAPDASSTPARSRRAAWAQVAAIDALRVLATLPFLARYGWHRDELYYAAAGRRLAWGYVDFPPVTAWLARLASAISGNSLVGLRMFALLASALTVMVWVGIAVALGGARRAMLLTATVGSLASIVAGTGALFQTVPFDLLASSAAMLALARWLTSNDDRWLIGAGAAFGIAIETKYTAALLAITTAIALLGTPAARRRLRRRPAILATLLAVALCVPNLWWQATNGWPSFQFFRHGADESGSTGEYVAGVALLFGAVGLVLIAVGIRHLWRDEVLRCLAGPAVVLPVLFAVLGGKSYYAAPALVVPFAAGAVVWGRWRPRRAVLRTALPAFAVLSFLLTLPIVLPVLPARTMISSGVGDIRGDYLDEIGWREMSAAVASTYTHATTEAGRPVAIIAANWGEASALDRYRREFQLPTPLSGHLSWALWGRGDPAIGEAVVVGFSAEELAHWCASVTNETTVDNEFHAKNEERGMLVARCALKRPLPEVMTTLQRLRQ